MMINRDELSFSLFPSVSPSPFTGQRAATDIEETNSFEVCVDSIFSRPLSTVYKTDPLGHEVKMHLANQWHPETHMHDLALQADPVF